MIRGGGHSSVMSYCLNVDAMTRGEEDLCSE